METMDEVFHAVRRWNDLRTNEHEMLRFLNQGDCFSFHRENRVPNSDIHAYPAVWHEHLYFITIPEEYDNVECYESGMMFDFLRVCKVSFYDEISIQGFGIHRSTISKPDAYLRIDLWNADHDAWIKNQVNASEYGIYQAFVIPQSDVEEGEIHLARFALRIEDGIEEVIIADLIIENFSEIGEPHRSSRSFDDLVTPVPPFSLAGSFGQFDPSEPTEEFFILKHALS